MRSNTEIMCFTEVLITFLDNNSLTERRFTMKSSKGLLWVLFLCLAKWSSPVLGAELPDYTCSWAGNTWPGWPGGAAKWVQQDIDGMFVTGDGTVYTNIGWEEGGANVCSYKNGDQTGIAWHTHGWGNGAGECVAANSNYLYFASRRENEGGGLQDPSTWPPNGYDWYGVARRFRSDITQAASFDGAKGGAGDTIVDFLMIFEVPWGTDAAIVGMYATDTRMYVACPYDNTIKVYDAETMAYITSWSVTNPSEMCMDSYGKLWIIQPGTNKVLRYDTNGTKQAQEISLPGEVVPSALCVDTQGRLLVADAGENQQIRIYTNINSSPTFDSTFGVAGGILAGPSPGEFGNLRFNKPMGVGVDSSGNVYVASRGCTGGGSTVLESYTSGGTLNWHLFGLEFVDCAGMDPGSEVNVYTKEEHFVMDYSLSAGQEWSYKGYTVNRYKYPDDPRVHLWSAGGEIRRFQSQKFLVVNTMGGLDMDYLQIYRFDPSVDGEVAIPSVLFAGSHKDIEGGTWPPYQPSSGEWIWRDSNGDGAIDSGEYTDHGGINAPYGVEVYMDKNGEVWNASETDGIRRFPVQGLDSYNNPIYNYSSMITYSKPAPFDRLKRLRYYPVQDVMYLGGTTTDHVNQHWKGMGPVICRYDNWNGGNRTARWQIIAPYEVGSAGHSSCEPITIEVAGDYLFVAYTGGSDELGFSSGHIEVYNTNTGDNVGYMEPGEDIGEVGLMDIQHCIAAHQRSNGEYIIFQEEDYKAKIVIYRWNPGGGPPLRNPDNPGDPVNGLEYKYYEGTWDMLPDFDSLTPVEEGLCANFDVSSPLQPDFFGYVFEGYVDAPAEGTYTFYTTSDDGSKLYIGSTAVVNNDGLHGMQEKSGQIGLKTGKHAIKVTMFEKDGGHGLEVRWEGPGITKQLIPNSALYRDTTPPAAPAGLTATPGDGEVLLDWNDNSESDLAGYNVYRSTTPGSGYSNVDSLLSGSAYTDSSVTNGTTYYYVVTAVDTSDNESGYSNEAGATPSGGSGSGTILREWWEGIGGTLVGDLTSNPNYPDNPTGNNEPTSFEAPTDWADNYGTQMRGYVHPSFSGDYTFWIASDDNSELWLSTDDNPANASLIANVPGWTNSREWTKYVEQQSAVISLTGGQKYYIESLHKEGAGGDNLAVAWQGLGISQQVIDGSYLSPWISGPPPDTTPPAAPTALTATAGDAQVSLDWADNTEPDLDGYNVYRSTTSGSGYIQLNGSLLSSSDYTDNSVSNGTTYYYVVTAVDTSSNESGYSNEDSATPTDTTPPAAPTGLAATPGDATVSLDWNDNGEGDLDGYNVYRSTTSGSGYSQLNGSLLSSSDYTDNSVSNDTTYYYVVTAIDTSSNESGYSNEDSATPTGGGSVVVFSDSFENGEWNGLWTEDSQADWYDSTQRAVDGSYSAEVDGSASDAALTSIVIDLQGKTNATVTFFWLIEVQLDSGEYLAFDVSTNGGTNWVQKAILQGNVDPENTWHNPSIDVTGISGGFQIRFRAKMSRSNEDANVDMVEVLAW